MVDRGNSTNPVYDLLLRSASAKRLVGIEVEHLCVWPDGIPLAYSSSRSEFGMGSVLKALSQGPSRERVENESGQLIGLKIPNGKISLEPGSQLEFATNPMVRLSDLETALESLEDELKEMTNPYGLSWISLGVHPNATVESVELIPVGRYRIMDEYLRSRGKLSTAMMRLTASIQLNFDYASETEAIEMLQIALLAAPLSYALFGYSPVVEKNRSRFLSYRGHIWRNTDSDRSGLLSSALAPEFNLAQYSEILWNCPLMYCQNVQGEYVEAKSKSLRQIASGEISGIVVDAANTRNAVQEVFFEARIKPGYVEIRSIDALPAGLRMSAIAFWYALINDPIARAWVREKFGGLTPGDRQLLWESALLKGLEASVGSQTVAESVPELFQVMTRYLESNHESHYIEPLQLLVAKSLNPAQELLAKLPPTFTIQELIALTRL